MPDFGPGSRIRPKALVIQLDPLTSDMVEAALHFDVELPSGQILLDVQHWWKEAGPDQRADAHFLAMCAVHDIAYARELEHRPDPKPEGEAEDEQHLRPAEPA